MKQRKELVTILPSGKETVEKCHRVRNSRELLCGFVRNNPLECDSTKPNMSRFSLKLALLVSHTKKERYFYVYYKK